MNAEQKQRLLDALGDVLAQDVAWFNWNVRNRQSPDFNRPKSAMPDKFTNDEVMTLEIRFTRKD